MKNLVELLEKIENMTDRERKDADFSSLPTFGGETPEDTSEIFSWDEESFLVQDCNGDFEIVDREDW